jgi:hypothetical protein
MAGLAYNTAEVRLKMRESPNFGEMTYYCGAVLELSRCSNFRPHAVWRFPWTIAPWTVSLLTIRMWWKWPAISSSDRPHAKLTQATGALGRSTVGPGSTRNQDSRF